MDVVPLNLRHLRGVDSNTLLRMYDRAMEVLNRCKFHQERARAEMAVRRIAKELRDRNVSV